MEIRNTAIRCRDPTPRATIDPGRRPDHKSCPKRTAPWLSLKASRDRDPTRSSSWLRFIEPSPVGPDPHLQSHQQQLLSIVALGFRKLRYCCCPIKISTQTQPTASRHNSSCPIRTAWRCAASLYWRSLTLGVGTRHLVVASNQQFHIACADSEIIGPITTTIIFITEKGSEIYIINSKNIKS